eukprot:6207407-Pleurochrysis_carterae.AAC.1
MQHSRPRHRNSTNGADSSLADAVIVSRAPHPAEREGCPEERVEPGGVVRAHADALHRVRVDPRRVGHLQAELGTRGFRSTKRRAARTRVRTPC